jgi:predicted nucleic acid-binding protein
MKEYIIDASVLVQNFITDAYSGNVEALLDEGEDLIELYTPQFCVLECANVLWKYVRFHNMPQTQAEYSISDLVKLPMIILPIDTMLLRSLQIGLEHKLAVYDSIYIALAEKLGYPLITVDKKQEKAAIACGVSVKAVTDFVP